MDDELSRLESDVRIGAGFSHPVAPDYWCRRGTYGFHLEDSVNALDALRPRVFQGSGALLVQAHPVLQFDPSTTLIWQSSSTTSEALLRPSAEWDVGLDGLRLGIHALTKDFDLGTGDWIIEVANCDVFLHLRPERRMPDVYKIASPCWLALTADSSFTSLISKSEQAASRFRQPILLLQLLQFQPHHLHLLQTWDKLMGCNDTFIPRAHLLDAEVEQYSVWFANAQNQLQPSVRSMADEITANLGSALRSIAFYLERWTNLGLWDTLPTILSSIHWQQFWTTLKNLRNDMLREFYYSRLQTRYLSGSVTPGCHRVRVQSPDQVGDQLTSMMADLTQSIDQLHLPELVGVNMFLGRFRIAEMADRRCQMVKDIYESDAHDVQGEEQKQALQGELEEFCSHLEQIQSLKDEYDEGIRGKLAQYRMLTQLLTRVEPREFLIC